VTAAAGGFLSPHGTAFLERYRFLRTDTISVPTFVQIIKTALLTISLMI
jgi:hypothetical protein